MLIEKISERD